MEATSLAWEPVEESALCDVARLGVVTLPAAEAEAPCTHYNMNH
jgi:hypothetical protein